MWPSSHTCPFSPPTPSTPTHPCSPGPTSTAASQHGLPIYTESLQALLGTLSPRTRPCCCLEPAPVPPACSIRALCAHSTLRGGWKHSGQGDCVPILQRRKPRREEGLRGLHRPTELVSSRAELLPLRCSPRGLVSALQRVSRGPPHCTALWQSPACALRKSPVPRPALLKPHLPETNHPVLATSVPRAGPGLSVWKSLRSCVLREPRISLCCVAAGGPRFPQTQSVTLQV